MPKARGGRAAAGSSRQGAAMAWRAEGEGARRQPSGPTAERTRVHGPACTKPEAAPADDYGEADGSAAIPSPAQARQDPRRRTGRRAAMGAQRRRCPRHPWAAGPTRRRRRAGARCWGSARTARRRRWRRWLQAAPRVAGGGARREGEGGDAVGEAGATGAASAAGGGAGGRGRRRRQGSGRGLAQRCQEEKRGGGGCSRGWRGCWLP